MNKEELISLSFADMREELFVNKQKNSRDIERAFNDELKHFSVILNSFNKEHKTINENEINSLIKEVEEIFDNARLLLMDEYERRFDKSSEIFLLTMQDLFMKKLNNANVRTHYKELNRYLNEMCRFNFFVAENQLENNLIDFNDNFSYLYINSEDTRRDFSRLMKNLEYGLVCNLKSIISNYISNIQDIVSRYNTQNKEIVNSNNNKR